MANKTIDQLATSLVAATVTDPSAVRLGVGDSTGGSAVSKKMAASELMKLSPFDVVADVTALLAVTHARDNQLFMTRGYSTEGVGANIYRYDAASTATIDGGFVLPGVGGTLSFSGTTFNGTAGTGRFIAVDQTVADVTKFGSDGSSESADALGFNLAVAAVAAAEGIVYFPPGTYDGGGFEVTSVAGITIKGDGKSSKIMCSAGENALTITTSDNVTVDSLWLYGSGDSAAASLNADNGLYALNCDQLRVVNCYVSNHGLAGILLANCSYVGIYDNLIEDAAGFSSSLSANCADIFAYGSVQFTNITIARNICASSNNVGIMIQPVTNLDCKQFIIQSNQARNHAKYGILAYVPMSASTDTTISDLSVVGNVATNNKFCGIYFNSIRKSLIVGNSVSLNSHESSTATNNSGLVGGIFLNACVACTVSGNTISDEKWYGIFVAGHTSYANMRSGIVLSGNTITNQTNANYPAIWISAYMAQATIVGNAINGNLSTGIYVDGTSGVDKSVSIHANHIDGVSIGATTSRAINPNGSNLNVSLVGNVCTNYYAGIVCLDNAEAHLTGNIVDGCTYEWWINGTFGVFSDVHNTYSTTLGSYTATSYTVDKANVVTRNGIKEVIGAGSPEGVVTAPIGSTYRRTDGGAGTSTYQKESGTGNTGWVGK